MKASHIIIASCLLLLGATFAQVAVDLPTANETIALSFYDGAPSEGAVVTPDFAVHVNDSAVGRRIHDVEDADHVVLTAGDLSLSFETWGINSVNATTLKGVNDGETMTLAEVIKAIYACGRGEKHLAIFTDDDVVTGFYAYYPATNPSVNIDTADLLIMSAQASNN